MRCKWVVSMVVALVAGIAVPTLAAPAIKKQLRSARKPTATAVARKVDSAAKPTKADATPRTLPTRFRATMPEKRSLVHSLLEKRDIKPAPKKPVAVAKAPEESKQTKALRSKTRSHPASTRTSSRKTATAHVGVLKGPSGRAL